tara:strand:+ start:5772 stop:6194 length:423 start_codon:yes stop_codon:yes gene_type:complete
MVNDRILSRFDSQPLPRNWDDDSERKIEGGPLYERDEVISLAEAEQCIRPSTKRCKEALQELAFDSNELADVIRKAVTTGRYLGSEWCRLSGKAVAACDAYEVLVRYWNEAACKDMDSFIYVKFAINARGQLILLVSCHV